MYTNNLNNVEDNTLDIPITELKPVGLIEVDEKKPAYKWLGNTIWKDYILNQDEYVVNGDGKRNFMRATKAFNSLSDKFYKNKISAQNMARLYENYRDVESGVHNLFGIARKDLSNQMNQLNSQYQNGQIREKKYNRLSNKIDRQWNNLNVNERTWKETYKAKNGILQVRTQHSVSSLPFLLGTIGLPVSIIGGITSLPSIGSVASTVGRGLYKLGTNPATYTSLLGGAAVDKGVELLSDGEYESFGDMVNKESGLYNLTKGTWAEDPMRYVSEMVNPGYWVNYGGLTNRIGNFINNGGYYVVGNLVGNSLFHNPLNISKVEHITKNLTPNNAYYFAKGVKTGNNLTSIWNKSRSKTPNLPGVGISNMNTLNVPGRSSSWNRVQYIANPNTLKLQTDLSFWKEYTKLKKSDEILKHRLSNDDNLNKMYKELGEGFKDPYLKQIIGKNPQYYAPMKYYMDVMGLDEISAWKQLITDRNTMYRTTAYIGNNADEVTTNIKNNLHKYTFEITANPNNKYNPSVVDFVRTEPNIGILYSGNGARSYMSPLWVLRRAHDQGQNTDAVFKYGDLPINVTGITTKSSPKLDFSGSHHEWYKRNLTLPKSSQSTNGNFSYSGSQRGILIPSELFNRYNLKNYGAKFVSYDPEKWNNYVHDEISPFMTEVVFQGPVGYRLPFKINEYDKTNLVKKILPNISKDREIPYYHSVGDLYHIFEPTFSIRMPLIPYGYNQGGKIISMK